MVARRLDSDDVNDTGNWNLPGGGRVTAGGTRSLAFVSSGTALACSIAILFIGWSNGVDEPPHAKSRALVSVALLAAPGVIGLVGALTRRRTVLAAAGVLCLCQSVVAFSGVTLVFLLPAIGFLRAATGDPDDTRSAAGPRRPAPRALFVLAAIAAVPIALAVVFTIGILGVVLLVIIGGVASWRSSRRTTRPHAPHEVLRGVAIVALVVGAWIASLAMTETGCWVGHAAAGGIAWEQVAPTDALTLAPSGVASTCASGLPTPLAIGLATAMVIAAIGVAALPWGTRPRPRVGAGAY